MAVKIEELLTAEINQPARYLGNELGAVRKPWDGASVRWVLTYPEVYEVGASNLGHIILYNILNALPRQLCDRAYLPAPDLAAKLRSSPRAALTTKTPLFAVESRRSLTEFDILGFSLSYELGATNILEMLDLAGIPLTWKERATNAQNGGDLPLIFAGGQTATSNPEPYADFFDFIALGDGEELLPEIGLILAEGKTNNLSREALLLDLAQIPGVYVPQFYDMAADGSVHPNRPQVPEKILRRVATPIPAYSIGLVPYVETVHDRLTVEIRRGCTRGCRFCQPGMLTRPARDVEPQQVVEAIEEGMKATGHSEFSLLSLSCSDYLALPAVGMEIKNRLKDKNISLSLPSQRVDRFDDNIADILGGTRQSGLTFAPEAGTQRMRDIVNKGLTNEELLRGVKTAVDRGWDKIKLYFMIGLPGETDFDVLGIAETVRWLQRECRLNGRRPLNFNLTISNFTPKPHTPFQWHSVSTAEFSRKQKLLKGEFKAMRNIKVNYTDVRISAMEDFVGRGDRRLGAVVRRAWELGAGMDAWWENLDTAYKAWTRAIDESGLTWKYRQVESGEWNLFQKEEEKEEGSSATDSVTDVTDVTDVSRPREVVRGKSEDFPASPPLPLSPSPPLPLFLDRPLPWDHLDTGIDKNWLKLDLQKALEAATVPDCSFEGCSRCGVCGTDFGHNVVVDALPIPDFAGEFVPNTERKQRFRVWFGKVGDMALVGHLDLLRLFDRVVRRADLPISFTGGFHPNPRISVANALPLGVTSTGEIADFELTESIDLEIFRAKLAATLPENIPIYKVESIDLKAPSASQLLEAAEYVITVAATGLLTENGESDQDNSTAVSVADTANWEAWVKAIAETEAFWRVHTTKSGKTRDVNLRDRLHKLELVQQSEGTAVLRYTGSCRSDGNLLKPEHLVFMLEQVSQQEIQLLQVQRSQLILGYG
ncbi:MAG: TIGR03960 family B12-binding radical SAM protein [Oscillatoriales cyanobacterium]|uniref:TIGR03960 family B12-binding radical SAM protein n=1 Tax=unclassified Microcoleus TaxID=2642155 RepID=UPI001DE0A6E6|nr:MULTISPECIES: TIGR03960 family B12-binding radical SAM protein [unclassified Microcoleus]TAF99746.1 MAG: TIGR03960 family B12-binding radical SAM protein [Oscillatoriales cyanobacterium]MCC3436171.1 TIGR03960 family B12-binding radical SAM protein [Microcoleus sp. PH2017_05_CCC_O_A]MCC3493028.1 TIGR03960 family B12-binding radical SAM protein [Microcoleus sp. PH2017_16_JOR_D_A]MCC3585707.1 TIGR03960 family B12-binding radical SAM protein [Microcoleus sp. PH2017_30_WIL_O_A]TAG13063.1 MAG: TI